MKASNGQWRDRLIDRMPPHLAKELDVYESEIALKKQGKIDDKVFAETRLAARRLRPAVRQRPAPRRPRHPEARLSGRPPTKGPNTLWDAPGMQRIKIPFGGLNAAQLEVAGGAGRGILRRHRPRHHAPGLSASLHPHRGHAVADAPACRRRDHHARGLRQHGPQRHGLPDRRSLPRPELRRDALRQGCRLLPARPSGLPGLRPQVQDRLLRLPRRSLRAGAACTTSAASPSRAR